MRQNPCNHHFWNSTCQNDEVSNDHPGSHCIALSCSPQCSYGSKIPGAIEVPTPPITEQSSNIEANISCIIVAAPQVLTESKVISMRSNHVIFPFNGQVRTQDTIKFAMCYLCRKYAVGDS